VRKYAARTLVAVSVLISVVSLTGWLRGGQAASDALAYTGRSAALAKHTVFFAGKMSEEEVVQLSAALAASGHPGILLFDAAPSVTYTRDFLERSEAKRLIAVGQVGNLATKYGLPVAAEFASVRALQGALFTAAPRVVIAPADQPRLMLQAACLAGVLKAPLLLTRPDDKAAEIKRMLAAWKTVELFDVGAAAGPLGKLGGVTVFKLADEDAVTSLYIAHQIKGGSLDTLVVANPADRHPGLGHMSVLAPWLALQKRAALLLTNDQGTDAEQVIAAALERDGLRRADFLVLAGNLQAIPMKKRPNPVEGGRDTEIEMEPMTPEADKPCSFATGRLFHDERSIIALMMARARLLGLEQNPRALIVSNPGGGLPLLETFSRHTAHEFQNAGFETNAYFGQSASKTETRRRLPEANIFLWEGHHSTLISSYGVHQWPEPLRPSLIFLQSCLALTEQKAHPFLQRGAVGVIGSSTRTYSGSGGAFSLAFFDTLLYEDQTLGASLRQAKNFMLAFAELKKRRFGEESKLGGANIRSAWAFTLWGDPSAKMARPTPPDGAVTAVKHVVQGNSIVVTLPEETHDTIDTPRYQATVPANARLAGLVRKQDMADQHKLVPFVFAEVQLSKAEAGKTPRLHTRLPDTHWVFCYDERCQRGYLLVTPRAKDHGDLRWQITWE
jgi:hypothetical protein